MQVIIGIWVASLACTCPFFFIAYLDDTRMYTGETVMVCRSAIRHLWQHIYIFIILGLFFVLPFFILVFIYMRIIMCLVAENRELDDCSHGVSYSARHQRKQIVAMLVAVISLFFMCLLPVRVVSLWLVYTDSQTIQALGLEAYLSLLSFARIMFYLNSATNPIVYNVISIKFRRAFRHTIHSLCRGQAIYHKSSLHLTSSMSFPLRSGIDLNSHVSDRNRKLSAGSEQRKKSLVVQNPRSSKSSCLDL